MGMVPGGRYLEISGTGGGQSVQRTSIRELSRGGGSRYMVWIEWTGGLAFGVLDLEFTLRPNARDVGHPGEGHDFGK